jgi:hypothetical protein
LIAAVVAICAIAIAATALCDAVPFASKNSSNSYCTVSATETAVIAAPCCNYEHIRKKNKKKKEREREIVEHVKYCGR